MQEQRRSGRCVRAAAMACALASFIAPASADEPLFRLQDARGDDHGNGTLIYPNRDDMQRGDLDIISLEAERRGGDTWFVVELAQPIRSPVGRVTELGQTPVERIARNGFYTFNVDIYVDTDRIAGSGQTGTVPGRSVAVDRQFAWEKAIVLTPRPDIARTMLQMHFDSQFEEELRARQGKVSKDELRQLQGSSEQRVNDLFFFPTNVRVAGRRIEFQVPEEFLGGAPSPSWGYTTLVTGAELEQTGRPGQLVPPKPVMMTMATARGVRWSQWGIRSDADSATPPVIDIIAPGDEAQKAILSNYDVVSGRLAAVAGVRPDGSATMAGSGEPATPEQLGKIESVTKGSATDAKSTPTERRTVPARLRTLNELLEDGLITQAEYNELRRKILAEL
jgi:hypothetical protein